MVYKYFLCRTKNNSIVDNNVKKVDYIPEKNYALVVTEKDFNPNSFVK